jgi:hypothetical protein
MVDLQIFDSTGAVRRDFNDEEIAALPKSRRAALFAFLAVYKEEIEAEADLANVEQEMVAANRAHLKLLADRPKIDRELIRLRELRAVINRPTA